MSKPSLRIAWIDLLETIAIVFVVIYHCTIYITDYFPETSSPSFYFFYFLRSILSTCVPLFFLANGFLLFRKQFDFKKHLRKIFKFTIITLAWYIITLAVLIGLNYRGGSLLVTLSTVKTGINHLWFMGALICLYLVFPLLKVVYDKSPKVFLYFVAICAFFTIGNSLLNEGATLLSWFSPNISVTYVDTNFFKIFNPFRGIYAYALMYFCLGGIIHYYFDKITSIPIKIRNLLAGLGLFLGALGNFGVGIMYSSIRFQTWDIVFEGYNTIFTLISVISIFLVCLNYHHGSRIFTAIAKNTLGIYLTHMVFIFIARAICGNMLQQIILGQGTSLLVSFASTILYITVVFTVSWLCSIVLAKMPLIRRLVR